MVTCDLYEVVPPADPRRRCVPPAQTKSSSSSYLTDQPPIQCFRLLSTVYGRATQTRLIVSEGTANLPQGDFFWYLACERRAGPSMSDSIDKPPPSKSISSGPVSAMVVFRLSLDRIVPLSHEMGKAGSCSNLRRPVQGLASSFCVFNVFNPPLERTWSESVTGLNVKCVTFRDFVRKRQLVVTFYTDFTVPPSTEFASELH